MNTIPITIHGFPINYPILIGSEIMESAIQEIEIKDYSRIAIITDKKIAAWWLPRLKDALPVETVDIIIDSGESEKNIDTVRKIWKGFVDGRLDRKSLVINLGGGVVGDMGGFAAATYMRGIDFLQIPTTLLAMVDASVGGKLGVDFEGYKNLIGSFAQPIGVVIDIETLRTLPDRQFNSGFAEIIKHGLIAGKKYFEFITSKKPREFTKEELVTIIEGSCKIKAQIVEQDEHESGLRKILNFGHTIGHAIESYSLTTDSPLLHGEAIAVGMVAEAKLSELMGHISSEEFLIIQHALEKANLPITYKSADKDKIQSLMTRDKKNQKGILKWTLLKELGEANFDIEVPTQHIETAINVVLL